MEKKIQIIIQFVEKNYVLSVLLFAVFFRLFILLFIFDEVIIFNDSESYIIPAKQLFAFDLSQYDCTRSFGYPLLIAILQVNLKHVIYFQYIIGIISLYFTAKTLLNLNFSKVQGFITTIVIHIISALFFYESSLLMETLLLFIFSILFYLLSTNYLKQPTVVMTSLLIVLFCLLILTKPFFVYLPFLIVFLIFLSTRTRFIFQQLSLLILPSLVFVMWCGFVKSKTGYFVTSTMFGIYKIQNCVYFAEKGPKTYQWIIDPYVKHRDYLLKEEGYAAMAIWKAYEAGEFDTQKKDFLALNKDFEDFAIQTISEHPFDFLYQVIMRSWFDFWKVDINFDFTKFHFKEDNVLVETIWVLKRIPKMVFFGFKWMFVGLTFYYNYLYLRYRKNFTLFAYTFIVFSSSILQALATYGTNERYSFPFEIIIICVVVNWFLKTRFRSCFFIKPFI